MDVRLHPQLGQCGGFGLVGRALRTGGGQHAQLALFNQAVDRGERVAQHDFKMCTHRIGHRLRYAFVRHMDELRAGLGLNLLDHDVPHRAYARGGNPNAARAGLGLCNQLLPAAALEGSGSQHIDG